MFAAEAVTIEGRSNTYVRVADSGHATRFQFCAECGSTVFWLPDAMPGVIVVPVGAFADSGFPSPTVSVYEERQHPWILLPDSMEHLD